MEPWLVTTDAFPAGRSDVVLHPRVVVLAPEAAPFEVELRSPDGTKRIVRARLDVAHMKNAQGTFALVRLLDVTPADVPEGTEVRRRAAAEQG